MDSREQGGGAKFYNLTLITGDHVLVWVSGNRSILSIAVEPVDSTRLGQNFLVVTRGNSTYVIPSSVDLRKFDMELFNVNLLIEEGYYKLPYIPVVVDYSTRHPARSSNLDGEKPELEVEALVRAIENMGGSVNYRYRIIPAFSAGIPVSKASKLTETLMESSLIRKIWLNRKIHASLIESVPLIGAPTAWALGYNGSGVKIAILDSGIDKTHPSLDDLDDNPNTYDPKVVVEQSFVEYPDPEPADNLGHGTHCAGIAAGTGGGESLAHSGFHVWSSGSGNNLDNTLDHEFDLTGVSSATLRFWTNYEMEPNYDFGYLKISTDGGFTWETLDVYNGFSGGWVEKVYDLTSYAGQTVTLRFEYITDFIVVYRGWWVDDISIPEIGFYDDVEGGSGLWMAEGWSIVEPVYRGVAPGAWLWNVKVLNQWGWGYWDWLIAGIEFAAYGPDGEPNTGDEADILSMSLGSSWLTDGTDPVSMAVDSAVEAGRICVVAAGNWGGYQHIGVPATARKAITVGASDKQDYLAYFSSCGPTVDMRVKPDLLAPGVGITSCTPWGYEAWDGTSMATPHVAGAAAILKQMYGFDPSLVKSMLICTADRLGYDIYREGGGRVNVAKAVTTDVVVDPATVSFGVYTGNVTDSTVVTIYNLDEDRGRQVHLEVQVRDVVSGAYLDCAKLNVTDLTLEPGSEAHILLTINTTLPKSLYSGWILIQTNLTESVHAVFGFAKLNRLRVHKVDRYGGDAAGDYISVWKSDPASPEEYSLWSIDSYLDEYGNITFYIPDGHYYIVSPGSDYENDITYWTIADNIIVTGDVEVLMDESETLPVTLNPSRPGQILCQKDSSLNFLNREFWLYRSFWSLWWYPLSWETRISPTTLNVTFGYSYYPEKDFKPSNPELVDTREWHKLHYAELGVAEPLSYTVDYSQLVAKHTEYRIALTPRVSAQYRQRAYTYQFDQWSAWTFAFELTAPQSRIEYLSPYTRYSMDVWKNRDRPGISTPYWSLWGYTYTGDPGGLLHDAFNSHPLHQYFNSYYWTQTEDETTHYNVRIYGRAEDDYGHDFYGDWEEANRLLIYRNDTLLLNQTWPSYSYWASLYDQPYPSEYRVVAECYTHQYLSPYIELEAKLLFNPELTRDIKPPYIEVKVEPEPNLNNTVPGGMVSILLSAYDSTGLESLEAWYSLDHGATWTPITLTELDGLYRGELGVLSDVYVSLKLNATDTWGNSITQTIIDGLYVAPLISPSMFIYGLVLGQPGGLPAVAGASVEAKLLDGTFLNSTETDESGFYNLTISGLEEGAPFRLIAKYEEWINDTVVLEFTPSTSVHVDYIYTPPTTQTLYIALHEGWNLIGISLKPENCTVEAVFGENLGYVESVFGYEDGDWYYWLGPGMPNTLTELKPGYGYWVKAKENFTLILEGMTAEIPVVVEDWNLVAVPGVEPKSTVEYLNTNYPGWNSIFYYDSETGAWLYYIKNVGGSLTTLEPGKGYWLYLEG